MADAPQSNSNPVRTAAAAVVVPDDPETRALVEKHSAGQPLTQREYGKIGAFAAKLKGWASGKPGAAPGPTQPGPSPRLAPGVATVATAQTQGTGLAGVEVDSGIAKRTTATVLNRCEAIAVRYATNAARQAEANESTIARLDSAVRIQKDDRDLIVDLSPDALRELGLDPRKYAIGIVLGTLGLWATNVWLVAQEFKSAHAEKMALLQKQASQPAAAAAPAPGNQQLTQAPGTGQPIPASLRPPGTRRGPTEVDS